MTLGSTLTPAFNAYGAYAPPGGEVVDGLSSKAFHTSFAFFLLFMGLLSLVYLICALRTNLIFVAIFMGLFLLFVTLAASYWHLADGHSAASANLQVAAGAFGFIACMAGWSVAPAAFPLEDG